MKAIKDGMLRTGLAMTLSIGLLLSLQAAALGQYAIRGNSSAIGSFFTGISDGATSLANRLTGNSSIPTATPVAENDPVRLGTNARPSVATFVSIAKMHEQAGRFPEAEANYHRALQLDPNYLAALLGQARIHGRNGRHDETIKMYHHAALTHPQNGSVFNNLGTYYGQRRMFPDSVTAYQKAVALDPQNAKYRDNLAIILAETGRLQEAFTHLKAAHGEDVAYYNLGFLLFKKGQLDMARQHFAAALQKNPNLAAARQMLERLRPKSPAASQARTPRPENVTSRSRSSIPRRLPPVAPNPPMLGNRTSNRPVPR